MKTPATLRLALLGAALLACGALPGCDDQGPTLDTLQQIQRNRVRWEGLGMDTYRYAVEQLCFCGYAARPVHVTVVDGTPVERRFVDTGDLVPEGVEDAFPTVDGLFEILFEAVRRGAFRIEVTYDPDTGVPLDFFIDYQENAVDEERGYRVTEPPGPTGP